MTVVFSTDYIDEINRLKIVYEQAQYGLITEAAGENASGGIIGAIKRIIAEVRRTISSVISSITNKIRYMCMSKEKKAQYDEFCRWLAANPAAKTKKITVRDWKRVGAEYDKIEKEIVDAYNSDAVDSNGLTLKATDMFNNLNSVIKASVGAITVDAAMYFAKSSPKIATGVQIALENNQALLKNIEDEIGTKDTAKVMKRIDKLTKESTFRRIMAKLGQHKERTLSETVDSYVNSLLAIKDSPGKAAVQHREALKHMAKAYKKDETVRKGVTQIKQGVKSAKTLTNNAKAIANNPMGAAMQYGLGKLGL